MPVRGLKVKAGTELHAALLLLRVWRSRGSDLRSHFLGLNHWGDVPAVFLNQQKLHR